MNETTLKEQVWSILKSNIHEGYSKRFSTQYSYIKPSSSTYPFQFWWDTCFHVFILCKLGKYELAKRNMLSLLAMQEPSGFVGHMIYWQKILPINKTDMFQAKPSLSQLRHHTSALVQPPLIAEATLRLFRQTKDELFLLTMLPKIKAYFSWLSDNRDFDGDGLISIITPFESGLDWKPTYDEAVGFTGGVANSTLFWRVISGVDQKNFLLRYNLKKIYSSNNFIFKEVLFNTLYVLDLRALASLCRIARDPQAEMYEARAKKVAHRIYEAMYDPQKEAFLDLYGKENTKSQVLTFTLFFPLILPEVPHDISMKVIKRHLFNKEEFDCAYPIPSVSMSERAFYPYESYFLWRGPTWVIANWFTYRCLRTKGYLLEANHLRQTVKRLIEKGGFREYYNPFSGEGYGANNFTWSGLILDMDDQE